MSNMGAEMKLLLLAVVIFGAIYLVVSVAFPEITTEITSGIKNIIKNVYSGIGLD